MTAIRGGDRGDVNTEKGSIEAVKNHEDEEEISV